MENGSPIGYDAAGDIIGLYECTMAFAGSFFSVLSLKAGILYNPIWKCRLLAIYMLSPR